MPMYRSNFLSLEIASGCQDPIGVLRVASELNHMLHPLVQAPVNSFEFPTRGRTPQAGA